MEVQCAPRGEYFRNIEAGKEFVLKDVPGLKFARASSDLRAF